MYRDVGDAIGPEYGLITDLVYHYDRREAIEVGYATEEPDCTWLKEPMHEQNIDARRLARW